MKNSIRSGLLLAVISGILTGCGGGGGGSSTPAKPAPSSQAPVVSSSSSSLSSSSSSSSSSVITVEPIAVKSTSYLNKNVDFTFSIHDLFDKWDSISRKNGTLKATESVGLHATGYADFQQNGSYSFISNTSYLLQYDSSGKPYHGKIIATDKTGKDLTAQLIVGNTDGCIHPRKALVADFNNDGRPDVFFACTGDDIPTTPGESSLIILSTVDGKYEVTPVKGTEFGYSHGASAADIDGDGNIDLVIADPKFDNYSKSIRFMMGVGDGSFIDDSSRIDFEKMIGRDSSHANYYSLELIERGGKLNLLAGGNEQDSLTLGVPTILAPISSSGFIEYDNVKTLSNIPGMIPLDFAINSAGDVFILRTSQSYEGIHCQKIDLAGEIITVFQFTDKISTAVPSTWIPYFELVNDELGSVNSDVDFIFNL